MDKQTTISKETPQPNGPGNGGTWPPGTGPKIALVLLVLIVIELAYLCIVITNASRNFNSPTTNTNGNRVLTQP